MFGAICRRFRRQDCGTGFNCHKIRTQTETTDAPPMRKTVWKKSSGAIGIGIIAIITPNEQTKKPEKKKTTTQTQKIRRRKNDDKANSAAAQIILSAIDTRMRKENRNTCASKSAVFFFIIFFYLVLYTVALFFCPLSAAACSLSFIVEVLNGQKVLLLLSISI